MLALHEVRDANKLQELVESIDANGWQGSPLVVWGEEFLLTGSHRYAACKELGMSDYEIPTIEIEEVFGEAGLNFDELHAEHGCPTISDYAQVVDLLNELPEDIKEKYGIDAH